MPRTSPAACRNCGKVPEPDSPHGLCARCLMARLIEGLRAEEPSIAPPAPFRRLTRISPPPPDEPGAPGASLSPPSVE
jgi:hypothetical protein